MQNSVSNIDPSFIAYCFSVIDNPQSSPEDRKKADISLIQMQRQPIALMAALLSIFQQSQDNIGFQALVYFGNILKRNWNTRRLKQAHSQFEAVKKQLRKKIYQLLIKNQTKRTLLKIYDILKFVAKSDYPHNYQDLTLYFRSFFQQIKNQPQNSSVFKFKQIREIFYELAQKKGTLSKNVFNDHYRALLEDLGGLSMSYMGYIQSNLQSNSLSMIIKISKYSDQIILSILRMAPTQLIDEQLSQNIIQMLISKLQQLVEIHKNQTKITRQLLQKNIRSLIYDFSVLNIYKPLFIASILSRLIDIQLFILSNSQNLVKSACLRYSFIGIKKILNQYVYYTDQASFMNSTRNKNYSPFVIQLRNHAHNIYNQKFTSQFVQNILNFLISQQFPRYQDAQCDHFDVDQSQTIQRGKQKQLNLSSCISTLFQCILERFNPFALNLISNIVKKCIQQQWALDFKIIGNILKIIALLPSSCGRDQSILHQYIPIDLILQFICQSQKYPQIFAKIVSGWLDILAGPQIQNLIQILLSQIQKYCNDPNQTQTLMHCCYTLNKIIIYKTQTINLEQTIQRIIPVALTMFGIVQNPQVLWPMVALISSTIQKAEFNSQILVRAIEPQKLNRLVCNKSTLLVQALCDMFKSFLCVLPRNIGANSIYVLIFIFLSNHLSEVNDVNYQKLFNLWYVIVRQYSPLHNCEQYYIDIFQKHFRKNLFRKTPTLIYILEEYMLSDLIPNQINTFVNIVIESYQQADDYQSKDRQHLKIAVLSFQITLISKFSLAQVNSDQMLKLILRDFYQDDNNIVSPTVHNSLLSIINRYIILHKDLFFEYLANLNIHIDMFLQRYFKNMNYLTSNTAMKINAIAILSILNILEPVSIGQYIIFILQTLITQVELQKNTTHNVGQIKFIGKVINSPSLRFASNILSERKQQIRKNDYFQQFNLLIMFKQQISLLLSRTGINYNQLASQLNETYQQKLLKLFSL